MERMGRVWKWMTEGGEENVVVSKVGLQSLQRG